MLCNMHFFLCILPVFPLAIFFPLLSTRASPDPKSKTMDISSMSKLNLPLQMELWMSHLSTSRWGQDIHHTFHKNFIYACIHHVNLLDLHYIYMSCILYICSYINNSYLTHHIKFGSHTFLIQAYDHAWMFM